MLFIIQTLHFPVFMKMTFSLLLIWISLLSESCRNNPNPEIALGSKLRAKYSAISMAESKYFSFTTTTLEVLLQ